MILADQTSLERVRLRRARVDAPIARLRLSHLLSSASLKPPAMPPSAILIVRAMADPLPGRITKEFAPAALSSAEWERAAQDRLGAFYHGAARPLWEAASGAEAVLFADYGELLACLARDLASGAALGWWWSSILHRLSTRLPGSWAAVWMEQPRFVPAALEYLESQRQAIWVLERIAPVQAWNLLTAMLRAFDLPALVAMREAAPWRRIERATTSTSAEQKMRHPLIDEVSEMEEAFQSDAEIASLPWEPYVPRSSTPPQLGFERQALLGMALLLRRAPQAALRANFPFRFRTWLKTVGREEQGESAPARANARIPSRGIMREASPADWKENRSPALAPEAAFRKQIEAKLPSSVHEGLTVARAAQPKGAGQQQRVVVEAPPREWQAGEPTRAGGILYLIHFLRQAELLRFETRLSGWALIELLARCLLDEDANVADDAMWDALAHLDGRDPRDPPSGFVPRRTYEAPASWLMTGAGSSRFARFRSRGVEIWTEEGFLVFDSEDHTIPSGLPPLRRKLRPPICPMSLRVSRELRRFLHFAVPYARWRIGRALGGTRIEDAFLRKGKLYVTATHVDLVMPLSEISVPVRLAGLDANPGWVPELGRVITFHFGQEGY